MLPARIPSNEPRRQRHLDELRVLDSLPEEFSAAVATAAAVAANMPMSAVSLIDADRQWLKASCGLGSVAVLPRSISFCAHAILSEVPLIVTDARLDERFSDNPLVTGVPFVRFYAGFPIIVNGSSIGALCVVDDRPRSLSPLQIFRLSFLAAGVAAWLCARSDPPVEAHPHDA